MKGKVVVYRNQEELAEQFSDLLMEMIEGNPSLQTRDSSFCDDITTPRLQRGISTNKSRFDLAISGGSTPQVVFSALASKYPDSPLWQKTHFWWVDERMVPPEHPESNFGVANRLLFSKIKIPEKNIHRIKGENEPYQEAKLYALQIKSEVPAYDGLPYDPDKSAENGRPAFDLVILGLGEDGHTASIFPNQMELLDSEDICTVAHHPLSGQARVTLTGKQINHATAVCFLVTGANKSERLAEIDLDGEKAKLLPAAHISTVNGNLTWYCDTSALKLL